MTKLTITCVMVNYLIVSSLANTTTQTSNDSTYNIVDPEVNTKTGIATFLTSNLLKQSNDIISIINNFLANSKELGVSLSKNICSTEQNIYSDLLNNSLKSLMNNLIAIKKELLSNVNIPETPNLNDMFDEYTNISDFKIKNLNIKGLENMSASKFNYNLCALSSEIEIKVPKIETTGTYTLKGVIDNSTIFGNGSINLTFDDVYAYDQSFQDCNLVALMNDVCKISNRNRTTIFDTAKVTVNVSGIKYKNLTEEQINLGLNEYINNYIKSNKFDIIEKITDSLIDFKHKIVGHLSPALLLKKLKNYLEILPTHLEKKQKSISWKENTDLISLLTTLL